MNDSVLRQLFNTCKEKNRFVFEVCSVFGDELTIEEMEYWFVYNVITNATVYDVDISNMSFENAIDEIDDAVEKRKRKWQPKGSSRRKIA
jgi:broad-specificity NMP kinase